uniref:Uncharacterized protein n=1 Tax=Heterorhabditis bacteriophora TaxID=37862 RepID=A0A1I7XKT8_HETBA
MNSDDDSIDFDITISGSRLSVDHPLTPPPTTRKALLVRQLQSRFAFCALGVFVLFIVLTLILLVYNLKGWTL